MSRSQCLSLLCVLSLLTLGDQSYAKDLVRLASPTSSTDKRFDYSEHILRLALKASSDHYGSFEIVRTDISGPRDRMLLELKKGLSINVHSAPTNPKWEQTALPVMFPLLKGLLNYRVFLIHKDNEGLFSSVRSIDQLKNLTAGLGEQWSTTKSLRKLGGFKIETSRNYEALFSMLSAKRFDYFIRGVNEVYREYDERKDKYPNMMIEPTILLELPLPWFFFVSPEFPRIAERIHFGLQAMKADGTFDREFMRFHGKHIDKVNQENRIVLKSANPLLTQHQIYEDASYWLAIEQESLPGSANFQQAKVVRK